MPPFLSDFRHTINRHVFHKVFYIRLSLYQNAVFPYHYCKIQWLLFPNLPGRGQSVVMVTHDMRSARRGNRILYLKDGTVLGECDLGPYVHGARARHEKLTGFLAEMGW